MGHFGAKSIQFAWLAIVFPSLALNYAGQAAIVLAGGVTTDNIFYRLCPTPPLMPMILLATVATVIASQSIIAGAFSMTRQAIQLGWFPRLKVTQTSAEGYGQIYVGPVNWLLMVVTISLTIGFGKSDNLAAAYGIAVSATMLMTSALLLIAMREIWQWSLPASIGVAGIFLVVDAAFFVSNSLKIVEGGYVPLLLAGAVYTMMFVWHRGADAITERINETLLPLDTFMAKLDQDRVPRVPGTAVFLTRAMRETPPVLVWHVRHNRALQQHVLAITTVTESVPWIADEMRVMVTQVAPNFWRAIAHYGFMERPDIPRLLGQLEKRGCTIDLADVTYFVGHETVIRREDGKGLPRWQEAVFAFMERNAAHLTDFFNLPSDQVVEIGRQISI
jgi:KUP system potassium uptake protein